MYTAKCLLCNVLSFSQSLIGQFVTFDQNIEDDENHAYGSPIQHFPVIVHSFLQKTSQ